MDQMTNLPEDFNKFPVNFIEVLWHLYNAMNDGPNVVTYQDIQNDYIVSVVRRNPIFTGGTATLEIDPITTNEIYLRGKEIGLSITDALEVSNWQRGDEIG